MTVGTEEIQRIAALARLGLEPGGAQTYARDLSAILELVARLDAVDTESVEPLAHPLEIPARLRPDEVTEGDRREEYLRLAPRAEDGVYLVPKVIE